VYSLAKSKTVASVRRHFGEWQSWIVCHVLCPSAVWCYLFVSIALSFLLNPRTWDHCWW
jgi:hypothetical protein